MCSFKTGLFILFISTLAQSQIVFEDAGQKNESIKDILGLEQPQVSTRFSL